MRTHVFQLRRPGSIRQSWCALALSLCFVAGLTGISFLFDANLQVSASSYRQDGVQKLNSTMNPPELISFAPAPAKPGRFHDRVWRENDSTGKGNRVAVAGSAPKFYREVSLNASAQREVLRHAPMEFNKAARQTQLVMTLPMPDGTLARFDIEESPVMAPELAARFSEIKTYRGKGLDDPTATTRFDVTPRGFHATVLSAHGTVIIEPAAHGRSGQYLSYDQRDAPAEASSFSCVTSDVEQSFAEPQTRHYLQSGSASLNVVTGATLHTYRLALAATAEYTQQYGGGTVAGALATMTTLINSVNAIYERDLAIHLTLIGNETSIIFTNTATDGYTSDDIDKMLAQNQTNLDRIVGAANYDVGMVLDGHVYAFQPGHFIFQGKGQVQSVGVNGQKGKGVSILRSTDPTSNRAIYLLAHELGHMFGAVHTLNGTTLDCGLNQSRFPEAAYEPGSGSTIMAFRGGLLPNGVYWNLCGDEEVVSTDTYFHTKSIEQIVNYTSFGNGASAGTITSTGNNPPSVNAGADYTIPAMTPFALTASGSDPDSDTLTYCWEEYDLGAAGPPNTDNGDRPIFRSFAPVATPVRTFPQWSDILSGTQTFGESLPITNRMMNFRVTVRDNHPGGGGVNIGAMHVNVVAGSGPFIVTQPGSGTSWSVGSTQTVTWDVANTASAPINCANVRVLLSIDGGNSFPITLVSGVPNSGAATITVPNVPTSAARVKVEASGNIFFNVSPSNFTITSNTTSPPSLLTEANSNRAIAFDSVTFVRDPFFVPTLLNFSPDQRTRIALLATGLELMPGESVSVVTAQAEDSTHQIYPLTVEYVGKVPNFDWLTQVNLRLPDGIGAGDALVSISLRGALSNKVVVGIH